MQKTLRLFFLFSVSLFFAGYLRANNPPANDSVQNAIDLGMLPAPGPCPNTPEGDTIMVSGSTNFATFNPLDFSVTHCFTSASPDVWYKFRSPGSHLYVEIVGSSGLNNFFVKLHHSQGSCLSIVPLECVTSSSGQIIYSFPTPALSGDYYMQIGGGTNSQTGDFLMIMKSFEDCNGCVKHGTVTMNPAPAFGRYNIGDTVSMCTTVSHWEALSTSHLHGIVPEFGPDWDTLSLTPTLAPISFSTSSQQWHWMSGIATPNGTHSGFFFDSDGDGDPSGNAGDMGNALTTWTGCWKIRAKTQCQTSDLSVDIHIYSDAETGSTNSSFVCNPYDAIHISTAMNCCPPPHVTISNAGSCSAGTPAITVIGDGPNASTDVFNYYLMDTSMTIIQSHLNVTGATTFFGLQHSQYMVSAENLTTSGCMGYQTVIIAPGIILDIQQTLISCTPGNGHAIVSVISGGSGNYSYTWLNIPAASQVDSLAFNLSDGWVSVLVNDLNTGCSATDSVYIITEPTPDATFEYANTPFCNSVDTISVINGPISPGGSFNLDAPLSAGITVDPVTGMIFMNNTTFAPPFYIYVTYGVGINCQSYYTDSVLIIAIPAPPVPTSATTFNYCIGSAPPVFGVTVPITTIAGWYDVQTSGTGLGNNYTPPLNSSTAAGTYLYLAIATTFSGGCTSLPTYFVVNATPSPTVFVSNDTSICTGDVANLAAGGCSCTYLWSPAPTNGPNNTNNSMTSPTGTTTYTVDAIDGAGCSTSANITVTVDASGLCHLHVYSGLTPNNDGSNDQWVIDGIDASMDISVSIFNRWGEEVWQGDHYDNATVVWKGDDQGGKALPDGTYYYIITSSDYKIHNWIELSH